jgi:hypothetical protein
MELGNTQACSPWSWKALYICSVIVLGSCLTPILWVILFKDALKMMLQLIDHCLSKKKNLNKLSATHDRHKAHSTVDQLKMTTEGDFVSGYSCVT